MKDMMEFKGYFGSVHYSDDDRIFYGKLEFIKALVSYEGTSVDELRKAFEDSVEEYLATCLEEGVEPETPFKGSFNIRAGSDLHRRLVAEASRLGIKLNRLVVRALEKFLENPVL